MIGTQRSGRNGRTGAMRPVLLLVSVAAFVVTTVGSAAPESDPISDARRAHLEMYAGAAVEILADELGVTELAGKPLDRGQDAGGVATSRLAQPSRGQVSDTPPDSANNDAIRYFPNVSENEPTIAVNPRHPSRLVAGTHFIGDTANRCVAHYSRNRGKSWNPIPIFMPQLARESSCSDPVLAYAPDGSRVYYAYMDIGLAGLQIVVSHSDDDGKTWSGPVVALSLLGSADYDKPWIGTHVPTGRKQSNADWVYISATRFDFAPSAADCHIDFTRSSNKGVTWSAPQTLDSGACSAGTFVTQGSRPQGGLDDGVIVAWYNAGADGFLNGDFQIRTRYSADNGATFAPTVTAANDSSELPFFLGPDFAYHRWWGGMFPDVEIAQNGTAHILYTHDPEPGSTLEDGNIRYVGSAQPPYATWSAPTTVNDDASGKAQGWATLEAVSSRRKITLYGIWEDHRTSATDNQFYDVFWAKRSGPGTPGPWAPNRKLTDEQSTSDFFFLGDYYDLAIARDDDETTVYGAWTDRRDEPTVFDLDDDVWSAQIEGSKDDD